MRTNIEIDDELMAATIEASGRTTKKGAVEEAMRHYIRAKAWRDLVEGLRGTDWDDGLGTIERLDRQRGVLHAAEDGAKFDRDK